MWFGGNGPILMGEVDSLIARSGRLRHVESILSYQSHSPFEL